MTFPQLRVRSGYSFRSAYGRFSEIIARIKSIDSDTMCLVDSGTWGHCRFEKEAKKSEIEPGFGMEIAIAFPEGHALAEFKPRAWILAEDTKRLYPLTSKCIADGALSVEDMSNARGVIRFTGGALDLPPGAYDYIDINPSSLTHAFRAAQKARREGAKMVLTSYNDMPDDSHVDFAYAWEVRDAVGPRGIYGEADLRRMLSLVLSEEELDQAVQNTKEVAARIKSVRLARAPIIHLDGDVEAMAREGQKSRLARGHIAEWTQEYEDRFQIEFKQIKLKGFDSYFLMVADLIKYAKTQMLVGPGRGSSAGSLICYLMEITEVDPIPHDLLFHRFIDISRADFPDIDIDFSDTKRHLVFEYLQKKYGRSNVCKLGSINTLKAASLLAQVGKKFGLSYDDTQQVRNSLIDYSPSDSRFGKGMEDTLAQTEPGKEFSLRHPNAALCLADLELHPSHSGVHAGGIIVCNDPIDMYCTVNAEGIPQVDKPDAEYLNLLKIDALGLRTLGIIEDANVVTAEELYSLKLDDKSVLDVLNEDRVSGTFQFEGDAVRKITRDIYIDSFEKIDHITSLARPGPMASGMAQKYIDRAAGKSKITYEVPHLQKYLENTKGVFLYQEQIMFVVKELGNFDWEQTSAIRKAMSGSKGAEFFHQRLEIFVAGCATHGIEENKATAIWNEMVTFGAYGFNRCISGETKIRLANPNGSIGKEPTIKQLYEMYISNPSKSLRKKMRQKKCMPILLCLDEENGNAYPVMAENIHFNGVKPCVRLVFSDGSEVVCTRDHKFIIDGEWKQCGNAQIGSLFTTIANANGKAPSDARSIMPGSKGWAKGMSWENGKRMELNGKAREESLFKLKMVGFPCEDCGQTSKNMEAHHNDFAAGKIKPEDLSWLCNGCHKRRHYEIGDRKKRYQRGQPIGSPLVLVRVEEAGLIDTYDIEMPDPWHNFELANGLVTHNSHSVSYAIVTYWTLWLKRYHRMAYAAACLRAAKDDEQTIAILRELVREGVEYSAIDPEFSDMNWRAVDGRLIGGIQNAKGYGPAKALKYVQSRNEGKLTDKMRETLASSEIKFADLQEAHTRFGRYYEDPRLCDVRTGEKILNIASVKGGDKCLVIAKLVKKSLLDENDPNRTKQRVQKGKKAEWKGPSQFIDLFMVDDSVDGPVRFRIRPDNYPKIGKPIAEGGKPGSWYLIRGWKMAGFDMFFIDKVKALE